MKRLLLALLLVATAASAAEVFSDTFAANDHHWRLDAQWQFADGALMAKGLPGQVLVVGCVGPEVADFRAILRAQRRGGDEARNYGFGLLYRFDAEQRDGYFVAIGAGGGYGFGKVEGGRFALREQGTSGVIRTDADVPLELEVTGDRHALRVGETLVDVWRDDGRRQGSFGLVVIEDVEVAFRELRIESLKDPLPPRMGPMAPGAPPPPPVKAKLLGRADVDLAAKWRRQFNQIRTALGEPTLPERLDVVDLAVLALLKSYHVDGVLAPATMLADWLRLQPLVQLGAQGPAAEAAVSFWLAYAAAPRPAEEIGAEEDLLAALSWYQAVRARAAAGAAGPLQVSEVLAARLEADRRRYERAVEEPARAAHEAAWAALGDEVLEQARRLAGQP